MKALLNNRGMAILAFGALLGVSCLAAVYPSNFPTAAKSYDAAMIGNIAWMLVASSMVLLMTPGLAFFYGGMVSKKNIISTMLQSFIALGIISIVWFVVGFSLAFGEDVGGWGIIGNPATFFMFNNVGTDAHPTLGGGLPLVLFAAFQLKFAIITPALITGSFAERVRFWGYVVFINLFIVFIYCPLAHMAWHPDGILFKMGVLDFAGGTVVHISAGVAALVGAMVLGKRKESGEALPVNIPFVILGTGMLWFGWFGFNAGSALAANSIAIKAFVNTNLASAVAAIAWIMMDTLRGKKPSALGACIGAVVGLVAITPAAGYVNYGPSLFIGFAAAIISNYAVVLFKKSGIDDTLDVFPCHGIGGISGMILTSLFATETFIDGSTVAIGGKGLITTGSGSLLVQHLITLAIVIPFVAISSWIAFKVTAIITPLRVGEDEELEGLDISQHDETISIESAAIEHAY
jgi:ammonium transporter, Amt family